MSKAYAVLRYLAHDVGIGIPLRGTLKLMNV